MKYLKKPTKISVYIIPFTETEIIKQITNSKNKKAIGEDDILIKIL